MNAIGWILGIIGVGAVLTLLFSGWVNRAGRYNSAAMRNDLSAVETDGPPQFPTASGFNLLDDAYTLPRDFEATHNIVLMPYDQQQQSEVNTWLPLLTELEGQYDDLRYYELPTLPAYNPLFRSQVDNWMIAGIPDPDTRSRTITLYLDVETFNAAMNINGIGRTQLALVTRDGSVLWQGAGSFNEADAAALRQTLSDLYES